MPARGFHQQFDEMLASKGVICEDRNGARVHAFMDRGAKKWGRLHRELDPRHDAEMIRPWIAAQVKRLGTISQDTATDYVRIAWGHVVLDYVASTAKDRMQRTRGRRPSDSELDWDSIYRRAWRYHRESGFHRVYYRGPNRDHLEVATHWLFGRGDKARG